jgi:hypothetical protein
MNQCLKIVLNLLSGIIFKVAYNFYLCFFDSIFLLSILIDV